MAKMEVTYNKNKYEGISIGVKNNEDVVAVRSKDGIQFLPLKDVSIEYLHDLYLENDFPIKEGAIVLIGGQQRTVIYKNGNFIYKIGVNEFKIEPIISIVKVG